MTIGGLLITCAVMKAAGYEGGAGMAAALAVASMVCIAISIGGDISQDLKIGFLVGATPKWVQVTQILSVLTSAGVICFTISLLSPLVLSGKLQAPQSHLMFFITKGVIAGDLPWIPVFIGMGIGATVELMGIASLPFAVGLYLPFNLSSTLMFGAVINYLFNRATPERAQKPLYEQGLLLSSGMVAGDALLGVGLAALIAKDLDKVVPEWFAPHLPWAPDNPYIGLVAFLALCAFLVQQLRHRRREEIAKVSLEAGNPELPSNP